MKTLVQCIGVRKRFATPEGEREILRGVTIDLNAGQLVMVEGPSGCGKTTLMSIIGGLLVADEGSCRVLGHDLGTMSANELAEFRAAHIGFIFQQFYLLPFLSVQENVAMPLIIRRCDRRAALERANYHLAAVGMEAHARQYPDALSGGQQQRVAIARALVHSPDLIICDEPTSSLDNESAQLVIKQIARFARADGRAVVIVTHDKRLLEYGDVVVSLAGGVVTSDRSSVAGR